MEANKVLTINARRIHPHEPEQLGSKRRNLMLTLKINPPDTILSS
jgi:hypothetical protein